MKKIIVTLALAAAAAVSAFGQIGVGVGYQTKTYSDSDDSFTVGGVYAGATYNYALNGALGVAFGLDLNYLTGKESGVTFKESNIGIPVLVNYAIEFADGFKLLPFAGPTFSFGISNKAEASGVSVDLYSKDLGAGYKRFDIMIGGGVALDVNDLIRVSIGYNKGLLKRVDDTDVTTGGVHFGVAYLF